MLRKVKSLVKIGLYRFLNLTNSINSTQVSQLILMNQYRQLAKSGNLPKFEDTGCHICSQTDEDGFLLFIFSLIGSTNKKIVEICAGDGMECNAANLIINHGWEGLLFDGDPINVATGKKIYGFLKNTRNSPPKFVRAWITAENVNNLITRQGFEGEIDLLSLDIDGVDYWVWKSINCINPRVVILEYNKYWGPEASFTVPYDPNFTATIINNAYYCGASLRAFSKLANDLGYRLVGSNSKQYNAFFVRNDMDIDVLPEVSVEQCLSSCDRSKPLNQYNFPAIAKLPWEKV